MLSDTSSSNQTSDKSNVRKGKGGFAMFAVMLIFAFCVASPFRKTPSVLAFFFVLYAFYLLPYHKIAPRSKLLVFIAGIVLIGFLQVGETISEKRSDEAAAKKASADSARAKADAESHARAVEDAFKVMTPKQHATEANRLMALPNPSGDDYLMANKHAIESGDKALNSRTNAALQKSLIKLAADKVDKSSLVLDYGYATCKVAVTHSLKAPATAEFGSGIDHSWHWEGHPGEVIADVQVDAQNTFGAKLRSTFECQMLCISEDTCQVTKMYKIANK